MTRACLTNSTRFLPSKQNLNLNHFVLHRCTSTTTSSSVQARVPPPPRLLLTGSSSLPCGTTPLVVSAHLISSSHVPQRSDEWFALRRDKLTTSSFSTALGFWRGNRRSELWHEKVFLSESVILDSARAAMDWGTVHESTAIEQYRTITDREVGSLGFASSGWLGASPDGVLGCYPDGGILEVKCPYNKGKPELALPWDAMPYYYMPQVQGLMEIMNREWVDFYCWTPNGSSLFRVFRDRVYWELIHRVLRDFWWGNVMPAREAVLSGRESDAKAFEPSPKHELTNFIIFRSRKLAGEARLLCRDVAGHVEFFKEKPLTMDLKDDGDKYLRMDGEDESANQELGSG